MELFPSKGMASVIRNKKRYKNSTIYVRIYKSIVLFITRNITHNNIMYFPRGPRIYYKFIPSC